MEKIWMKNWPSGIPQILSYRQGRKPIFEYLRYHARKNPNKVAINYYGKEISFSELDVMSDRFAFYLSSKGIKKGDRIALFLSSCPQYVIAQIGGQKAGGIVVPCSPMYKSWELESILKESQSETIVFLDELYPIVSEAAKNAKLINLIVTRHSDYLPKSPIFPIHESMRTKKVVCGNVKEFGDILNKEVGEYKSPEISMDDVCLLAFTGGTTGLPKGAMLTHGNQLFKSAANAEVYKYDYNQVAITAMPIFHIAGLLWGITTPIYAGCTSVIINRFEAETMAKAINNLKCTRMLSTVPMIVGILSLENVSQYDLSSLRITHCVSFGMFVTEAIVDSWKKITKYGFIAEVSYGLSETHTLDTFSPIDKPRIGSFGIPNYETDLKIVDFDDQEKELGIEQVGEITIKSPGVFKGYWGKPEETQKALRNGRVFTGDMGKYDKDGYVYFLGRKKEMIKSSGFNIAPEEVESYLMRHPAVDQAACIPVPHENKGEVVKAFIILRGECLGKVAEQEIIDWCKDKMAPYKCPRIIEFRKELPKNNIGKVLRRVLREEEQNKRG